MERERVLSLLSNSIASCNVLRVKLTDGNEDIITVQHIIDGYFIIGLKKSVRPLKSKTAFLTIDKVVAIELLNRP